ncbi:hypothetical protein SAMN04488109_0772 [Chryseolinea serpens]|uniref:Uncharacterized protein n=1 Tax=Chryseolinea serpens TaxID=947013 RepID=A0A1M5KQ62_9BACT|nr:hypothetical protein [Chryseolinea serpens]SHG54820.1 hypothetical protein SAMN04488109_0772 [Chryseolinea serpens]
MTLKVWTISIILLSMGTISYGQKSSDRVSNEICKCLEIKIPIMAENVHVKDSINACLGQGMATDMEGLRKEYKMKDEGITVEQIVAIRDRLWKKLEKRCEKFKEILNL